MFSVGLPTFCSLPIVHVSTETKIILTRGSFVGRGLGGRGRRLGLGRQDLVGGAGQLPVGRLLGRQRLFGRGGGGLLGGRVGALHGRGGGELGPLGVFPAEGPVAQSEDVAVVQGRAALGGQVVPVQLGGQRVDRRQEHLMEKGGYEAF